VKDETFCVVAGTVSVELEGTVLVLGRGDSIRIKPRQIHRFWGDGIVEEISTHHSDEDVVRLEESKNL
jgi:mannose-6-phosphate isomerase-like protein (cupin superfamily)